MKTRLLLVFLFFSFSGFSQVGLSSDSLIFKQKTDSIANLEPIYISVEQPPQFPGGDAEMMMFIWRNFKIPDSINTHIYVAVKFVVDKEGNRCNFEVFKSMVRLAGDSLGKVIDEEYIRVLRAMPKWIPGKDNGENVNCYYSLPLSINPGYK